MSVLTERPHKLIRSFLRGNYESYNESVAGESLTLGFSNCRNSQLRTRVKLHGVIDSIIISPKTENVFRVVLNDGVGKVQLVFLGRKRIAGLLPGKKLDVEGLLQKSDDELTIFNPEYTLINVED